MLGDRSGGENQSHALCCVCYYTKARQDSMEVVLQNLALRKEWLLPLVYF